MKKITAFIMTLVVCFSMGISVYAQDIKVDEKNQLTTRNMDGEFVEKEFTAPDGSKYMLSIEEVQTVTRANVRTWKVSFTSGVVNCHFYMDVSGNRVSRVYSYDILCIGCSYSNPHLSKTSKTGKLELDISSLYNIVNFHGWLSGTVTGSNNDINVNWNF